MQKNPKSRRKRCSICRKWYYPHSSALDTQKTCSSACRKKRKNLLAHKRRDQAIYHYRPEERLRQRECRKRKKKSPMNEGQSKRIDAQVSRTTLSGQPVDLAELILKKWDKEQQVSRARLRRNLIEMIKDTPQKVGQGETKSRACHAPPSGCISL
jgi:hypothetical protein